jgi:hypothetical protein
MTIRIILSLVLCIVFLSTANGLATGNSCYGSQKLVKNKNKRAAFRYVIISNKVDNVDPNNSFRAVEVLLDEKAFSEENLKKLFLQVSKRYPEPEWLKIHVYTSLEQVPTPEESEQPAISEDYDNPYNDKYHWAFFMREDGNEQFRYNPKPPDIDLKTVVLKGHEIFNLKK